MIIAVKIIISAALAVNLASCSDKSMQIVLQEENNAGENVSTDPLAYLEKYDVLKNYVNREDNPVFKLGVGMTVSEFLKKNINYYIACQNFDEMTAGKAMKHSSVVRDDGSMDFSTVTAFVQAAHDAGMTVYGHTLCWHSQQRKSYLDRLAASAGTEQERKDVLCGALETWIAGMMGACRENPDAEEGEDRGRMLVTAWDVVNEPMSDGRPDELKSASNQEAESVARSFYWQDYLGREYVRYAIKYARKHGGDGLLLFVNDYNLEATYNNNRKCEGLIKMIEYWESDGETRVDGIGTQMHVTYSLDPEKQRKNEMCVENMLRMLAATGKLIKISELDMGLQDKNGNDILTEDVKLWQHKAMAGYYNFIIRKYFEIIPPEQRYGITQWARTDSPKDSGWRSGLPIGLWDADFNRKPAYAGFANGLAGETLFSPTE